MRRLLTIVLLLLALAAATSTVAHAADSDLLRARIRLSMETTHAAVASEAVVVTDHTRRVAVVRGWVQSPETWLDRAVDWVRSQDAAQLDQCTGDALGGIAAWECRSQGTQASIDALMSTWLSVLVQAGHGG